MEEKGVFFFQPLFLQLLGIQSVGIQFLQFFLVGITIGAVYAMIALGFTTIFRSSNIINFAQGEFVMLGGVVTLFLIKTLGFPYPIAALSAIVVVSFIGFGMEKLVIYPIRRAPVLIMVMATLGASIFISQAIGVLWGRAPFTLPPIYGGKPIPIAGIFIAPQSLWVLGVTVLVLFALHIFSYHTIVGKAMEASSTDPVAAKLVGIPIDLMVLFAFGVSAAVGAVAGILIAPIFYLRFDSGALLALKGFVAAVLGGWGKGTGAVLGGFVLGVMESLSVGFISSTYKDMVAFLALLLILYFRPRGILGSEVNG
ncbi:MAG: branched-chain amino acid ABC transporter permease [Thermodesulfobacteriota bacterium]|nr:branched-chain amino acid ABC transporter permease [Thermodesulfobacteriota bacterium]